MACFQIRKEKCFKAIKDSQLGMLGANLHVWAQNQKNRKVGIIGAEGRMGRAATHALLEADGLEVVALFDVNSGEKPAGKVPSVNSLSGLIEASPEVVVDFTVAEASLSNLPQIAEAGIHAVVGTSGFTEENHEFLDGVFQKEFMSYRSKLCNRSSLNDEVRGTSFPMVSNRGNYRIPSQRKS